jgi:hypothetical protein
MAKIGIGTLVGLGAEGTYGTEAARSVWWRVESADPARKVTHTPVNTLSGVSTSAVRDESVITKEDVTGTIRGPMSYRGMGLILKHALGAVADSGSDPYTHAYTHTIALLTGLTVEILRGNTASAEELLGVRISKLTLEITANGYMTWEIEVIGKTGNARASGGSPSLTTPYRILAHHCPGVVWNSATQKWTRLKLTIDNKLTAVNECGSLTTSEPERGDMATVECEVEFYPTSNDWYTAHLVGTSSDLVATFTEPVTSETFTIRAHAAKIVEYADPLTAPGLITGRVLFRGHASGSDLGVSLTAVNNQSSGVA